MKSETGSSARLASRAALSASAFLASAAWRASFAADAASSFAFASALAVSGCRCASPPFGAAFRVGPGLVGLGGSEHLLGMGELGVGAGLERFELAQRQRERRRLARRCRGGALRRVGRLGGRVRLAGERLGARRRSRDDLWAR